MNHTEIYNLQTALLGIKERSRPAYRKAWEEFLAFFGNQQDFEARVPTESEMIVYFRHLREELLRKSSTMWTTYSKLNGVIKGKYSFDLNKYQRLKSMIKSYDTDTKKKANVFSNEDIARFFRADLPDKYWLVRRAICVLAYFGGLRLIEIMNLQVKALFHF